MADKNVFMRESWRGLNPNIIKELLDTEELFYLNLPTVLVDNKSDLDPVPGEVEVMEELLGLGFPSLTVSAETGQGLDELGPFLFDALEIVRVYTKTPGKPADTDKPFTVRSGGTVLDVAKLVHRDIARSLKYARMWGPEVFDGQQVGPDHAVCDGDTIELHF